MLHEWLMPLLSLFLNQLDPSHFDQPAFPFDQIFDEHAPGRNHVRNVGCPGNTRSRPCRPKEDRMQMHHAAICDARAERSRERWGPIEAA